MKIIGICTKSIEELKLIAPNLNYKTFLEFYEQDCVESVILVDNPAKLLLVEGLNIIDMEYYNQCWRRKNIPFSEKYILRELENSTLEVIKYQHKWKPDYNLGNFSFIQHLKEYNLSPKNLLLKIHNLLSKTKKESIQCSEEYMNLLRIKLINSEMSKLYCDFLGKKKQEYPVLFKYMKYTIDSCYAEKDKKELEKMEKELGAK